MIPFLIAVFPSAGVLFLFWIVIRALLQADRRERVALARLEARGQAEPPAEGPPVDGGR